MSRYCSFTGGHWPRYKHVLKLDNDKLFSNFESVLKFIFQGMVGWSKATNGGSIENWWTQGNSAAWSKGGQGFVAISNEGLSTSLQTGLPAGSYCNVIQVSGVVWVRNMKFITGVCS